MIVRTKLFSKHTREMEFTRVYLRWCIHATDRHVDESHVCQKRVSERKNEMIITQNYEILAYYNQNYYSGLR